MAWALALLALAAADSPLAHVVGLLKSLESTVQQEGRDSATAYDEFACFCKTNNDAKVSSINDGETNLNTYRGNLKEYEGERDELKADISELELSLDAQDKEMHEMTDLRENEHAHYTVAAQDASVAISQLGAALQAIEDGGMAPRGDELLQVQSRLAPVAAAGSRLGLTAAAALLSKVTAKGAQDDLLGQLEDLKSGFEARKTEIDTEEAATETAFKGAIEKKREAHTTDSESLSTKQGLLATAQSNIATTQEDIQETEQVLADDKAYLAELTRECEAKAKEWDQEASMRGNELKALAAALEILEGDAATTADTAGESSLIAKKKHTKARRTAVGLQVSDGSAMLQLPAGADQLEDYTDVVFTQVRSHSATRDHVVRVLQRAAQRAPALAAMAAKVEAGDPFAKVKSVIQSLIEQLVVAATDEAAHKGWCDTNMEKARTDRLHRQEGVTALNLQIEAEEARQAELKFREEQLTEEMNVLQAALLAMTKARQTEKDANKQAIEESQRGIEAIQRAIELLRDFYRHSGHAKVAEQAQVAGGDVTSTVQSDKADAGVAGPSGQAYQGNQGGAAKVLGMLKVVEHDFTRTRDEIMAAENLAAKDFTEFAEETNASISAKKAALKATENDLTRVTGDLEMHIEALKTEQGLLDSALKILEDLKPSCLFTGMSYEEHKRRREEEIATLKYAVCVLDDDGTDMGLRCDDLLLPPTTTAAPVFLQRGERSA